MCCPDVSPTSAFLIGLMCLAAFGNFAKTSADFSGYISQVLKNYTDHACDGEYVSLRCPHRTTISIQSSFYGRIVPSHQMCPSRYPHSYATLIKEDVACSVGTSLQNRREMNQLQALLNDSLIRTKHVENAAIINIKERKVCASTFGFNVPPENALNLIYTFHENLLQVRRGGLYFKDKYYKCVRADEHSIYLQNPDGGLIIVKTKTFILAATYRVGMYPSVCVEAVEKLADYFREKGS